MLSPQVSVVVPALNAQRYVAYAITSALSQTFSELEVIVVDDGSNDSTVDEVSRLAERDRRVRLVRHAETLGASAARNSAIAAARGEWIAPLDADDAFTPNRVDYLLRHARETGADLVADNLMLCTFPARLPLECAVRPQSPLFDSPLTLASFVGSNRIAGNIDLGFLKPIIRRRFLEEHSLRYRADLKVVHDFYLYIEILTRGAHFVLLPEAGYLYSIRSGSLSNCGSRTALDEIARSNRDLVNLPLIAAKPEWRLLFNNRQRAIDSAMLYAGFTEAIRKRHLIDALAILRDHPYEFAHFAARLWEAMQRRVMSRPYRPQGGVG